MIFICIVKIEHILDNPYVVLRLVTIHDVTYKDIIRTCGYHYDETNWDAEKQEFVDYEGFKDFEIEKVKRNLEHMKKELSRDKLLRDRADFSKFFSEHDRRRGTDFLATFPEMSQFYFMCEEAEALNG